MASNAYSSTWRWPFCTRWFYGLVRGGKNIYYITGLAGNKKLKELAQVTIDSAEREYNQYVKPVKGYHSFSYKAAPWNGYRRVIVKAGASNMGANTRYIVPDMIMIRGIVQVGQWSWG